jgi:hypothetical protein
MKLKHLLTLSIACLLMISSTRQESVNQPQASPITQSDPTSTESARTVNQQFRFVALPSRSKI